MARGSYVGVSEVAERVSKIYVGVEDKARKVIKGYVGVNNKARQFWPPTPKIGDKIIIFLNGSFDHVPTGFNLGNNYVKSDNLSVITQNLGTNKALMYYTNNPNEYIYPTYIPPNWDVDGIKIDNGYDINSNPYIYNNLFIPLWNDVYKDANRLKCYGGTNTQKLIAKLVVYGNVTIMFCSISGSSFTIRGDQTIINTDTPQEVTIDLVHPSSSNQYYYYDYIIISSTMKHLTNPNTWITEHKYGPSTGKSFSLMKFTLKYVENSHNMTFNAEVNMKVGMVYSVVYRYRNSSTGGKGLGILISRTTFSVTQTWSDETSGTTQEEIVDAEQLMEGGNVCYCYYYDFLGTSRNTNQWFPESSYIDSYYVYVDDIHRFCFEFLSSLDPVYFTTQIPKIEIDIVRS